MTTPNIEELMLLVDAYAMAQYNQAFADRYDEGMRSAKRMEVSAALQSQAERISGLEKEVAFQIKMKEHHCKRLSDERDNLRAQLAEIAASEPVAKLKPCKEGWFIDLDNPPPITGETIELFTRPLPAQDVNAELVEALERLLESTTGVDQVSTVNEARKTLSKYKGAK